MSTTYEIFVTEEVVFSVLVDAESEKEALDKWKNEPLLTRQWISTKYTDVNVSTADVPRGTFY